jgi:RNA polymerase sigma-70 factor (ECF subfamily)
MDDIEQVIEESYKNNIGLFLSIGCNIYHYDLETSRDILQETFEKIWSIRQRLEKSQMSELSVRNYALKTYRNRCIDHLRKIRIIQTLNTSPCRQHSGKSASHGNSVAAVNADPLHEMLLIEQARLVSGAIDELPSKCSQVVRLSLKGLKPRQIVEKLGINKNKVRNLKHRCFKILKQILKKHDLDR